MTTSTSRMMATAGILLLAGSAIADPKTEHGVFQYVVERADGDLDAVVGAIDASASGAGWRVLSRTDAGVPEGCSYRAVVLSLLEADYADALLKANPVTAPYAIVDRVNVFEDENGVHVAIVNPRSILRTVLMDDTGHVALAESHLQELRALVLAGVRGVESHRDFGQVREEGHIGKTFGVVAGGPFDEKIEVQAVHGGSDWRAVAAKVRRGFATPGEEWQLRIAWEVELPEQEAVVFGLTGAPMEGRSFEIVGAGADGSRAHLSFPGLAHAAAYPLELVVRREGMQVRASTVDVMYRMKMYFEDAGKWAFMKNMGMPGSIEDEIRDQVHVGFENAGR